MNNFIMIYSRGVDMKIIDTDDGENFVVVPDGETHEESEVTEESITIISIDEDVEKIEVEDPTAQEEDPTVQEEDHTVPQDDYYSKTNEISKNDPEVNPWMKFLRGFGIVMWNILKYTFIAFAAVVYYGAIIAWGLIRFIFWTFLFLIMLFSGSD